MVPCTALVTETSARAGVVLVEAPGTVLGPDHELAGMAEADAAPSTQTVPAAAAAVAILDIVRLSMVDPRVLKESDTCRDPGRRAER
jgi:hypothetical protein